jgi:flagellar biosynthesis/type III secretory pathway protein FliH
MKLYGKELTRDDLIAAFRPHGTAIRLSDEWVPLARHALTLIEAAYQDGYQAGFAAGREAVDSVEKKLDEIIASLERIHQAVEQRRKGE